VASAASKAGTAYVRHNALRAGARKGVAHLRQKPAQQLTATAANACEAATGSGSGVSSKLA
jgi:hypothetical protein